MSNIEPYPPYPSPRPRDLRVEAILEVCQQEIDRHYAMGIKDLTLEQFIELLIRVNDLLNLKQQQ